MKITPRVSKRDENSCIIFKNSHFNRKIYVSTLCNLYVTKEPVMVLYVQVVRFYAFLLLAVKKQDENGMGTCVTSSFAQRSVEGEGLFAASGDMPAKE